MRSETLITVTPKVSTKVILFFSPVLFKGAAIVMIFTSLRETIPDKAEVASGMACEGPR
jgi:hypothetical protein